MTRYDHAVDASWAGYGSAEGLVIYPLCFFFHFQENYSNFENGQQRRLGEGTTLAHIAATLQPLPA